LFLVLWEKKMTRITIRTGYFFYFFWSKTDIYFFILPLQIYHHSIPSWSRDSSLKRLNRYSPPRCFLRGKTTWFWSSTSGNKGLKPRVTKTSWTAGFFRGICSVKLKPRFISWLCGESCCSSS
jgi:hypothetical protein